MLLVASCVGAHRTKGPTVQAIISPQQERLANGKIRVIHSFPDNVEEVLPNDHPIAVLREEKKTGFPIPWSFLRKFDGMKKAKALKMLTGSRAEAAYGFRPMKEWGPAPSPNYGSMPNGFLGGVSAKRNL